MSSPLPLIFITGATGFIGSHVVLQVLEAGHPVLLSVRKPSQIESLKALFHEYTAKTKLDFVVIPDLSAPGAFHRALEGSGVTYVFHLASPMPGTGSDFQTDYLGPAVQGTISLLDAANEIPTIKRVVIVSSLLALIPLDALVTGKFHAKEGTNPNIAVDSGMEFPADPVANAGLKYHASKILAHRASLEWMQRKQPHFDVVSLHPSFVFGCNLTQTAAADLNGTNAMLWGSLFSEKPLIPMAAVDVRDVALAHVKALDVRVDEDEHHNMVEEFLLSAGPAEGWTWNRVAEFVKGRYPNLGIKLIGPSDQQQQPPPVVETKRAEQILGMQWRPMEQTVSSFLDHQIELRP